MRTQEYFGQSKLRDKIMSRVSTALLDEKPLPHMLIVGPRESGKRTLAEWTAAQVGAKVVHLDASGTAMADLTGALAQLTRLAVLVVEELHLLGPELREVLIRALADRQISVRIGNRPGSKVHYLPLPPFTCIGLTSRPHRIEPSMRRWFVMYEMEPYSPEESSSILRSVFSARRIMISLDAARRMSQVSGRQPGDALATAKRVEQLRGSCDITPENVDEIIIELGLNDCYPMSLSLEQYLTKMEGRDFESWAGSVFRLEGFTVEYTDATGDHGIDILLKKK